MGNSIDREKVVKALMACTGEENDCAGHTCPYWDFDGEIGCRTQMELDALSLLTGKGGENEMKKKYKRNKRARLIREIEFLKKAIKEKADNYHKREKELLKRIEMAGSEIETIDNGCGPMQVIRAEVETFGTYAMMFEASEREMEYCKQNMAKQIAKKLIDENIAQIIVHEKGENAPMGFPMYENSTIGVKLFVIPWEQMRTVGQRFEMRRKLDNDRR